MSFIITNTTCYTKLTLLFASVDLLSFESPLAESVNCILSPVWNYLCVVKYLLSPQSCAVSPPSATLGPAFTQHLHPRACTITTQAY